MEDTKYLPELLAEKDSLDSSFTHAMKLISAGKREFGGLSARRGWPGLAPQRGPRPGGHNVAVGRYWGNSEPWRFPLLKAARWDVQTRCQG